MPYIVKKTLTTIIKSGNDYVICVKKNQKKLYKQLEELCSSWSQKKEYQKRTEKNRGRKETRKIYLYRANAEIQESWEGSKVIIKLKRERIDKGKKVIKTWYYISSKNYRAKEFLNVIRGHWLIENRLHWVKDKVMNEDTNTIKNTSAAPLMSIIRTIILNTIRRTGSNKIKSFMELISGDIDRMLCLIE